MIFHLSHLSPLSHASLDGVATSAALLAHRISPSPAFLHQCTTPKLGIFSDGCDTNWEGIFGYLVMLAITVCYAWSILCIEYAVNTIFWFIWIDLQHTVYPHHSAVYLL